MDDFNFDEDDDFLSDEEDVNECNTNNNNNGLSLKLSSRLGPIDNKARSSNNRYHRNQVNANIKDSSCNPCLIQNQMMSFHHSSITRPFYDNGHSSSILPQHVNPPFVFYPPFRADESHSTHMNHNLINNSANQNNRNYYSALYIKSGLNSTNLNDCGGYRPPLQLPPQPRNPYLHNRVHDQQQNYANNIRLQNPVANNVQNSNFNNYTLKRPNPNLYNGSTQSKKPNIYSMMSISKNTSLDKVVESNNLDTPLPLPSDLLTNVTDKENQNTLDKDFDEYITLHINNYVSESEEVANTLTEGGSVVSSIKVETPDKVSNIILSDKSDTESKASIVKSETENKTSNIKGDSENRTSNKFKTPSESSSCQLDDKIESDIEYSKKLQLFEAKRQKYLEMKYKGKVDETVSKTTECINNSMDDSLIITKVEMLNSDTIADNNIIEQSSITSKVETAITSPEPDQVVKVIVRSIGTETFDLILSMDANTQTDYSEPIVLPAYAIVSNLSKNEGHSDVEIMLKIFGSGEIIDRTPDKKVVLVQFDDRDKAEKFVLKFHKIELRGLIIQCKIHPRNRILLDG